MRHNDLRAIVDRFDVDAGDPVEHLVRHGFQRLRCVTDAGIVDEDIEPAKFAKCLLHDRRETGLVGDIRDGSDGPAGKCAGHAPGSGLIAIGNDYVGAFGDEFADDALAEAGAAAGHDCDLVFQSHGDPRY